MFYVALPVVPISQFKAVGIIKGKGKPNFLGYDATPVSWGIV